MSDHPAVGKRLARDASASSDQETRGAPAGGDRPRAHDQLGNRSVARMFHEPGGHRDSTIAALGGQVGNAVIARMLAGTTRPENPTAPMAGAAVDPDLARRIDAERGGGSPLPDEVRAPMQERLGTDLQGVRVHTDAGAATLARSVQAQAFTTGQDIFFDAGKYQPGSASGRELIAHETVHVAQQASGCLAPDGRISDPADPAELEAHRLAAGLARSIDAPPASGLTNHRLNHTVARLAVSRSPAGEGSSAATGSAPGDAPGALPASFEPDLRANIAALYGSAAQDPVFPDLGDALYSTAAAGGSPPSGTGEQLAELKARATRLGALTATTDAGETLTVPAALNRLHAGFQRQTGIAGLDLSLGMDRIITLLARDEAAYLAGAFAADAMRDTVALSNAINTAQAAALAATSGKDLLAVEMEGTVGRLLELRTAFAQATAPADRAGLGAQIGEVARRALLLDRAYRELAGPSGKDLHLVTVEKAMATIASSAVTAAAPETAAIEALGNAPALLAPHPVATAPLTDEGDVASQTVLPEEAFPRTTDAADEQFMTRLRSRIQDQAAELRALHDAVVPANPTYTVAEFAGVHRRWHGFFSNAQESRDPMVAAAMAMAGDVYQVAGTDTGNPLVSAEQGFARAMLMPMIVTMFTAPRTVDNPSAQFAEQLAAVAPRRAEPEVAGAATSPDYRFGQAYGRGQPSRAGETSSREATAQAAFTDTAKRFSELAGAPPAQRRVDGLPVEGSRPVTPEQGWTYLVDVVDPNTAHDALPTVVAREQKTVPPEVVRYLMARQQAAGTLANPHRPRAGGQPIGGPGTRDSVEQATGDVAETYVEGQPSGGRSRTARDLAATREAASRDHGIDPHGERPESAVEGLQLELERYLDTYFAERHSDEARIGAIIAIAVTEYGIGSVFQRFTDPGQIALMVGKAIGLGAGLGMLRSLGPLGRVAATAVDAAFKANGVSDLTAAMSVAAFLRQASGASSFPQARAWALVATPVAGDLASIMENLVTGPITDLAGRLVAGATTPNELVDVLAPVVADPATRQRTLAAIDAEIAAIDTASGAPDASSASPERRALVAMRNGILGQSTMEAATAGDEAIPSARSVPDAMDTMFQAPRQRSAADRAAMELALGDLAGQVPIAENPALAGSTVRVHYGEGSVRIEYGPAAEPRHVRAHVEVARQLRRFDGVLGRVRGLLARAWALLTGHPEYAPGSQAFESRLEVRKLNAIIKDLEARLGRLDVTAAELRESDLSDPAVLRGRLETELREATEQLQLHETNVDSFEQGRGFVAKDSGSAAPPGWPEQAVNPKQVKGGWTGLPDTVPPGVVLVFPDGGRVWRTLSGSIAIESSLGPPPGRAGHEATLPARGAYSDPGFQQARYELAHSQGQGTGHESPYGILLAPQVVNQRLQRYGIEEFLYKIRDEAPIPPGTQFHIVTATDAITNTRRLEAISYRIDVTINGVRHRELFGFTINVTGPVGQPKVRVDQVSVSRSDDESVQMLLDVLMNDVDMSAAAKAIQKHFDKDDVWKGVSFGAADDE